MGTLALHRRLEVKLRPAFILLPRPLGMLRVAHAVAILSVSLAAVALGAKPEGGGGSDATGKILFSRQNAYHTMNPDGSQLQMFFAPAISSDRWIAVSSKKYSGRRWILAFQDIGTSHWVDPDGNNPGGTVYLRELFAYRTDGVWVQLTDLSKWGLNNDADSTGDVSIAWSNDNEDTFFSIRLRGHDVVGSNYVRSGVNPHHIARVELTGGELDVIAARNNDADPDNNWPLIGELVDPSVVPDPLLDFVVTRVQPKEYWTDEKTHGWDPTGTQMIYTALDSNGGIALYRRDLASGADNVVLADVTGPDLHVDWSPDGTKIAVGEGYSILLVNPDGSGLNVLRLRSTSGSSVYYQPYWSPDGKWIAYARYKSYVRYVARIPSAGGKEVVINGNGPGGEWPLGWSTE